MSEQTKERMGHEEWLRFKAWVWLVGGTESARSKLGVSAGTLECLWLRHPVAGRVMSKVRASFGKGAERALA